MDFLSQPSVTSSRPVCPFVCLQPIFPRDNPPPISPLYWISPSSYLLLFLLHISFKVLVHLRNLVVDIEKQDDELKLPLSPVCNPRHLHLPSHCLLLSPGFGALLFYHPRYLLDNETSSTLSPSSFVADVKEADCNLHRAYVKCLCRKQ